MSAQLELRYQAGWHMEEPPKDGTRIVAIGKVIIEDAWSTTADPFCTDLEWTEKPGQSKGWHLSNGMSLVSCLEDEVIIHYWMPYPLPNGGPV